MPHEEQNTPCPAVCRAHSGIDSELKTIFVQQNEMRADMKTKVPLKIFIAAFALIVTVAVVVTGFQWSTIAKAETLDRAFQEKMSDKVQTIQQDISVIKALTVKENGG